MVLYVILVFAAILVGMAISVFAFGTGGKRSRVFQDIYFTVEEVEGIGVLYTKNGDYSAVLAMENPVQKYSANIDAYYELHFPAYLPHPDPGRGIRPAQAGHLLPQAVQGSGRGAAVSSSPTVISAISREGSTPTPGPTSSSRRRAKGSKLFSYDARKWRDFMVKVRQGPRPAA
jgi:hypothetical protein